MNWNAKLRGVLHGEVAGADVAARLLGAYPLTELRRQLADQRLEAEIAYPGEEWRLTDDLGGLELALWRAEMSLVLAQSLVETEQEAHPDRPTMMSPVSHDEALTLLGSLDAVLAQVSTGLADPERRPALSGVTSITPTSLARYQDLPLAYLKAVQRGAERLEGASQAAISDLEALVGRSGGPEWIAQGIRTLRADLAGAQTTLQALSLRVSAPGGTQGGEAAGVELARELWQVVNAYLRAGQLAIAPRLMPGAPPLLLPPPIVAVPPQPQQNPPVQSEWDPPQPRPRQYWTPPPEEPARVLPKIVPTWEPAALTQERTHPSPVEEPARPLPDIAGGRQPHEPSPSPRPAVEEEKPRPLPQIGAPPSVKKATTGSSISGVPGPDALPVRGTDAPRPLIHPAVEQARSLPRIGAVPGKNVSMPVESAPPGRHGEDDPRPLPQIGVDRAPVSGKDGFGTRGGGKTVARSERWSLSSTTARRAMRARGKEEQAEHDLAAFWEAKGWRLSAADQAYRAAVAALTGTGGLALAGRSLATAPFPLIHTVIGKETTLLGQTLAVGALVTFDYVSGRLLRLAPNDGVPD